MNDVNSKSIRWSSYGDKLSINSYKMFNYLFISFLNSQTILNVLPLSWSNLRMLSWGINREEPQHSTYDTWHNTVEPEDTRPTQRGGGYESSDGES